MHRLLIALSLTACTATVRTAGPPPSEPAPPPPPPPVVHDHRPEPQPTPSPPPPPPPSQPPPATTGGAHPHYGDAIRSMRYARALIARTPGMAPDVRFDEQMAVREIDAAIEEVHQAKADDGMATADLPVKLDPKMMYRDRLKEAHRALDLAAKDLEQREDNSWALRDRREAIEHLRRAWNAVGEAISARADSTTPTSPPAAHAAYVAALGNLRHARALLERTGPAAGDVKWDEKVAIREIDAAFGEVKQARVDDGMPMTEHPPIDAKLVYRDRLREAVKLLGDSARDLEEKEDNGWAKKDRKQAVDHVRRAEKAVQEAISDRKADAKEKADVKAEIKEEKKEEKAEKKAAKGH